MEQASCKASKAIPESTVSRGPQVLTTSRPTIVLGAVSQSRIVSLFEVSERCKIDGKQSVITALLKGQHSQEPLRWRRRGRDAEMKETRPSTRIALGLSRQATTAFKIAIQGWRQPTSAALITNLPDELDRRSSPKKQESIFKYDCANGLSMVHKHR